MQGRERQGSNESGNALWFLLLAVALLAALTITMTRSSDTSEQSGNVEMDRIAASEIMRQAKNAGDVVNAMMIKGLSVNDISFENPIVSGYANPNCTTDSCKVFSPSGGGLSYQAPKLAWLDRAESASPQYGRWFFTGTSCLQNVGSIDPARCVDDPASSDLIMVLPWVTARLCKQIDDMVGITAASEQPPGEAGMAFNDPVDLFVGTFNNGQDIDSWDGKFTGKPTGCFRGSGGGPAGGYHFYHVLVAR